MMLMAETRPSSEGGVTDCRSVVVEITHRIGPTPSRKKLRPASHGVGTIVVSAITAAATKPVDRSEPDHGAEGEPLHHPRRRERADHHADAIHPERHADAGGGQAEMAHGIGHEHRKQQERRRVEDELRDEHRPQQRMMQHERGAFLDVLQRMAARRGRARRFIDAGQQHDRDHGERRGKAEGGRGADPSDQHAAERGAAGERDVRASSIRALAAGSCCEVTSEGTRAGAATL